MAKIPLDKYYTPKELAEYCVNKTKEIIGDENIIEYLEPSAGCGVFLDYLDKPYLAYDIAPEDERIVQADYLTLDLEYKKGRCIIGNPPYGKSLNLAIQFYKKSIQLSDYISFILPISQINNSIKMYEFDLIHSEDLKKNKYSDVSLHCCLNIYRRRKDGLFNNKPNYKLKDIIIEEYHRGRKEIMKYENYDFGMCGFGKGIIGKPPKYLGQYASEFYFKILNEKLKNKITDLLNKTDWEKDVLKNSISGQCTPNMWMIYKYIKEQIPEIE